MTYRYLNIQYHLCPDDYAVLDHRTVALRIRNNLAQPKPRFNFWGI